MKKPTITTKFFYSVFTVIAAIGFFLTDIVIEPYIVGHYVFPLKPMDAQLGTMSVIAMFALPSAIATGVSLGSCLVYGLSLALGIRLFG